MQYEPTTPQQDGFSMPAEFSPHQGCILIWPERPGSWKNGAAAARKAFRSVIAAIAESETVYVAVNPHSRPSAERMLAGMANVRLLDLDSDDAWARDVAPTFVRRAADGAVRGVNWQMCIRDRPSSGRYRARSRRCAPSPPPSSCASSPPQR